MNKAVICTLFVASSLAAAVQVQGQPPILVEGAPTALVPYGDLDLSRPAGQAVLQGRVQRAAERVCTSGLRDIGAIMSDRRCREAALTDAQRQIDRAVAFAGTTQFAQRYAISVGGR